MNEIKMIITHNFKLQSYFLLSIMMLVSCSNTGDKSFVKMQDKDSLVLDIQKTLDNDFKLWYPLSLDTIYGGYFSDINYKWELSGQQNKMITSQARHIWSASIASMFYKHKNNFLTIAEHGVKFLHNVMWDKEYGGFYELVKRNGDVVKEDNKIVKRAYGNSFAIYGLAAYYKATGNQKALDLAKQTFYWLEKHSYDLKDGGYFQFITREGNPIKSSYRHYPPKDQNSSIHLLECFTELYKVWPDSLLKVRLISLKHLIRDRITTEQGYMNLFFTRNWVPISYSDSSAEKREANYELDHVSFGHDIETAYLLLEANEVLGIENDTLTNMKVKQMVDHTIEYGWDNQYGGIFDRGYYFNGETEPQIIQKTKEWWVQTEALNSLLIMSLIYSDQSKYYQKFYEQWNYIKTYLIDHSYGGWYWGGIDQVSKNKFINKGSIWKVNYHTTRSLINCINNLKKLNKST